MKYSVACLILLSAPLLPAQSGIANAFADRARILFQGDSITDGNRGRTADPNHILGHGYVFIIAAKYGSSWPERRLVFLNRGVSGNTVADLANRWQNDTVALAPDILSILIGINDQDRHGTVEQYEEQYDRLLADTVKALPNVRLVLGEPFSLRVGRYDNDRWDERLAELQKRQAAVARLAARYHAALVHYQKAFDDACRRAPADYWIWDGIHPTYSGHQIMADEWLRTVDQSWSANK
jgi:lysophospholipase L1-like esterase